MKGRASGDHRTGECRVRQLQRVVACLTVLMALAMPCQTAGAQSSCSRGEAVREGKPYIPDWWNIDAFTKDAIERWKRTSGDTERAMQGRMPFTIGFRQEVCIQLLATDTDPWSGPIYCYDFIEETRTRTYDQAIPATGSHRGAHKPCTASPNGDREKPYFPIAEAYRPLVEDAIRRWRTMESPPGRAMEGRIPVVMAFPDENCVHLTFTQPSIGGAPTYCYDKHDGMLTRKEDEVE
jgi:hypothetical protein